MPAPAQHTDSTRAIKHYPHSVDEMPRDFHFVKVPQAHLDRLIKLAEAENIRPHEKGMYHIFNDNRPAGELPAASALRFEGEAERGIRFSVRILRPDGELAFIDIFHNRGWLPDWLKNPEAWKPVILERIRVLVEENGTDRTKLRIPPPHAAAG